MFKKLAFVFIIFVLIISCRKATTRPSISDVGNPPSEEGVPDIYIGKYRIGGIHKLCQFERN